jgi:DNA (cytosine-5)-methyltransferase 1
MGVKKAAKVTLSWDSVPLDEQAYATHSIRHPKLYKTKQPAIDPALKPAKPAYSSPRKKDFSFIDLFAGIGGFRLAGNHVGGDCVFTSEWDKYARRAYFLNYGEIPFGDITQFTKDDTSLRKIPGHDVLCGGFPCQAFSISGKQAGFQDPRGTLFFEIYKIAKKHRPKVLFLENVKNFARHDNGKTFQTIKHFLEVKMAEETNNRCSYRVSHAVLNASDFGASTKRERIYIVAIRRDLAKDEAKWAKWHHLLTNFARDVGSKLPAKHLKDSLQDEDVIDPALLKKITLRRTDFRYSDKCPKPETKPIRIGIMGKGGQGERIYSPDGHAITFSAYGGGAASKTGAYLIGDRVRKLTPTECANCMGFQGMNMDFDAVPLLQRYKQFGNSVVVNVVEAIFKEIKSNWLSPRVKRG